MSNITLLNFKLTKNPIRNLNKKMTAKKTANVKWLVKTLPYDGIFVFGKKRGYLYIKWQN